MTDQIYCKHCRDVPQLLHKNHDHYEVYCKDDGDQEDNTYNICAFAHEDAAAIWAEKIDSEGDYTIIQEGSAENVMVRKVGDKNWKKFEIAAENVPQYEAQEVDDD